MLEKVGSVNGNAIEGALSCFVCVASRNATAAHTRMELNFKH